MALDREQAIATVAAGLCLSRVLPPNEITPRAGSWILATMSERLDLPPVGVVADLGALLFGASLRTGIAVPGEDPALAAAVRRYEDAVLGRLAVDGRLASAGFAVARLPKEMRAQAVGILVAGVLKRIDFDAGTEVQPGVVRELTEKKPEEGLQRGYGVLRNDAETRRRLVDGYAALARCAQKARDLIGDADLFALENLTVLGSLTQRLAIADVVRAQEAISEGIPRRLPRRRRKEGDVASKLEDESVYPVGGFSSVSTSGSLENLVTSELIYMDPPKAKGHVAAGVLPDVDLFDMRYVEGELLYYTRDEAIFVRRRRLVIFALAPDLARARVKDRHLPWQRIVLVLGVVLVLTKKLVELLGDEALEIRLVFLQDDGPTPLSEERALSELMLREWRDKGMADVVAATWSEVAELAASSARRSLVEVVHIGATKLEAPALGLDPRVVATSFAPTAEALEGWSRATADLLSSLL
jgi:vWA domain found in the FtsH ternary systems/N-terminal helical region fused to the FtsH ternary system vWA domain